MTRLSSGELKKEIAEVLDRVETAGERIVLQRDDRDVAVLISVEDYALFRQLEDRLDRKAIQDSKADPGPEMDWETLKRECNL